MRKILQHRSWTLSNFGSTQLCRSKFSEMSQFNNNFLSTTNVAYIQSLYQQWQSDKNSVSKSFQTYFELLEQGQEPQSAFVNAPKPGERIQLLDSSTSAIGLQLKYRMFIDRIRFNGHQFAKISPLKYEVKGLHGKLDPSVIKASSLGLSPQQQQQIAYNKNMRKDQVVEPKGQHAIKEVAQYLQGVYCDSVGYEFMHLQDKKQRVFLRNAIEEHLESLQSNKPSKQESITTFKRLCNDQAFVDYLGTKFANFKRFGIQGLNSASSMMGQLFQCAAKLGTEYIVLGMAHRGRLNTLHCLFDKPAQLIFQQFLQKAKQNDNKDYFSAGDVKYHLGYVNKRKYEGKQVTLSILPNPSHLEAVDPLIYGQCKAIQQEIGDFEKRKVVGVLVHGDAALAGQGIVYESIQMHDLKDYSTGGIIHIVMNNQVGFTTNPGDGRSSYYCTEIAKVVGSPVFHVNADQPAVLDRCIKIAMEYRNKFNKDIFIDLVGYRKFGHNEQDQPFFTQPQMYEQIKTKRSVYDIYCQKVIKDGFMTKQEIDTHYKSIWKQYEQDYQKVISDKVDAVHSNHTLNKIKPPTLWGKNTGVPKDILADLFQKITSWPSDFNIHPTIKKIYQERVKNFTNNDNLDWATMESLAFASVLQEGYKVRLSGQDVERGTFSHRHALISDQKRDVPKFKFLKTISPNVTITNSHLSEYGVLGFQYGFSITDPNALVIWEAQFGDFANGAQIIIDNFIASSQTKWGQSTGIVMNLPHGMDGQGSQHSSGRIQRFLLLSDDNCDIDQNLSYEQQLRSVNISVVSCTTSSNYFHVLRRQVHRDYRKPLINFNSKKLLKFKGANRPLSDVIEGTEFLPVIPDQLVQTSKIKKVLLCNGQFYYELKTMREELKRDDIAIVRIEQLSPFPHHQLKKALSGYSQDVQYCWVQEDHENYGAWNYVRPRLNKTLGRKITYLGRKASASTAVGFLKKHKRQEKTIMDKVFGLL